jgi:hypothetical protein
MDGFFDDGGQAWRYASEADNQHYDVEYPRSVRFPAMVDHIHQLVKDYRPVKVQFRHCLCIFCSSSSFWFALTSQDRPPVMVVEGFLLYSHAPLVSLIEPALRFFLVAPPMVCSTRRFQRDHRRILPANVKPSDGRGPAGRIATEEASGTMKLWLRHNDFYWTLVWPAFLQCNAHILRYVHPSLVGSPPELLAALLQSKPTTSFASSSPTAATTTTPLSTIETKTAATTATTSIAMATSPTTSVASSMGITALYYESLRVPGALWCDAVSPSTAIPPRTPLGQWLPGSPPTSAIINLLSVDEKTNNGRLPIVILDGTMSILANAPVVVQSIINVMTRVTPKSSSLWLASPTSTTSSSSPSNASSLSSSSRSSLPSFGGYEWDATSKAGRLFTCHERMTLLKADKKDPSLDVDDHTLLSIVTMLAS